MLLCLSCKLTSFRSLTSRRVTCDVSHHSFLCYYVFSTSSLSANLLVTIKMFLCYSVFLISIQFSRLLVTIKTFLCYPVFSISSLFSRLLVTIKMFLCYYVFLASSLFPCLVPLSQNFSKSTLFNHIKVLLLYVVKVFIGIINNL